MEVDYRAFDCRCYASEEIAIDKHCRPTPQASGAAPTSKGRLAYLVRYVQHGLRFTSLPRARNIGNICPFCVMDNKKAGYF